MSLLIAEIGSNHFGQMKLAKELIRIANDSGADIIKGQAYRAEDITTGSMPLAFYKQCQLSENQCLELMQYARSLRNDMFFTIFSPGFERVQFCQKWTKLSASQTQAGMYNRDLDKPSTIVSIGKKMVDSRIIPRISKAWALYATEYMPKDPQLEYIEKIQDTIGTQVGLSDHTLGAKTCLKAIKWYHATCIEKHFTLQKDISFNGTVFRDTVHGANPKELAAIAKALH